MLKPPQAYQKGIQGDYQILADVEEICGYLLTLGQELHGRIFPPETYSRSLLTSYQLEERLSLAQQLTEVLYPLLSFWEKVGLENGPRLPLRSNLPLIYSVQDTSLPEMKQLD